MAASACDQKDVSWIQTTETKFLKMRTGCSLLDRTHNEIVRLELNIYNMEEIIMEEIRIDMEWTITGT